MITLFCILAFLFALAVLCGYAMTDNTENWD